MKNQSKNGEENNGSALNADLQKLKDIDVKKAIDQDLRAAIHFLCLLRDTPELLESVTIQLEQLLADTVKMKESQPEIKFQS